MLGPASYLGPIELGITRTNEELKIRVLKICWRDGVDRCLTLANLRDKSRLACYIPEGVEEITRLGSDFLLGFCSGKNVGH